MQSWICIKVMYSLSERIIFIIIISTDTNFTHFCSACLSVLEINVIKTEGSPPDIYFPRPEIGQEASVGSGTGYHFGYGGGPSWFGAGNSFTITGNTIKELGVDGKWWLPYKYNMEAKYIVLILRYHVTVNLKISPTCFWPRFGTSHIPDIQQLGEVAEPSPGRLQQVWPNLQHKLLWQWTVCEGQTCSYCENTTPHHHPGSQEWVKGAHL